MVRASLARGRADSAEPGLPPERAEGPRRPPRRGSVSPVLGHPVHDDVLALLTGADADGLVDRQDEDLPVADLAGARRADDGVDHRVHPRLLDHGLDLHLALQGDVGPRPAVDLGVAALRAAADHLGHGQPGDAELVERVLHHLQAVGTDDRLDLLHACPSTGLVVAITRAGSATASGCMYAPPGTGMNVSG